MNRLPIALLAAVFVSVSSAASAQPNQASLSDVWKAMQGKWVGEGTSEMGQGAGYFSFEPDLLGKVWVRRNHAEYPSPNNSAPPAIHEDLMVVYVDTASRQSRAFYVDTEGHVIQYVVTATDDQKSLTFIAEPQPDQPRYRLTYTRLAPGRMSVVLETAPADHPDQFKKIVEGTVRKQ